MFGRSVWGRRVSGVLGITLVFALLGPLANVAAAQAETRDLKQELSLQRREVTSVPGMSAVAPKAAPPAASKPAPDQQMSVRLSSSGQVTQDPDDPPPGNFGCTPYIYTNVTPLAFGVAQVDYSGVIDCNFFVAAGGTAYLIDRTPGSPTDGRVVSVGTDFFFARGSYGRSVGAVLINGRLGVGGRQFEIAFDFAVQTLDGGVWANCFELPGLRYLQPCAGLNTPTVSASVGTGNLFSGIPNLATLIRDETMINLINFHTGGGDDPASTARQNIVDAAAGRPARTSTFAGACCRAMDVTLDPALLVGMLKLVYFAGYSYEVSAVTGGVHDEDPPVSRHYLGKAIDVRAIFGVPVSASNPYFRQFMAACRAYGATELLGPGNVGHNGHVHCGWPR